MDLYTIVTVGKSVWFGDLPKTLNHHSQRAHLHAGIKDALAFTDDGERVQVTLYSLPDRARVPVIVAEVLFTRVNGRARDLVGDTDWLMPLLVPPAVS